jgi:hypothetical protein
MNGAKISDVQGIQRQEAERYQEKTQNIDLQPGEQEVFASIEVGSNGSSDVETYRVRYEVSDLTDWQYQEKIPCEQAVIYRSVDMIDQEVLMPCI